MKTTCSTKISSSQNKLIKKLIGMRKNRQKFAPGSILVEGKREIVRALRGGFNLQTIFIYADLFGGDLDRLLKDQIIESPFSSYEVTREIFERIAVRERSDGVIALFEEKTFNLDSLWKSSRNPFIIALSQIEKPGNLGAIMRVADGCGADFIVALEGTSDPFSPNSVRASVGSAFTIPIISMKNKDFLDACLRRSIQAYTAVLNVDSQIYTEQNFENSCAIILGNEAVGVDAFWLEAPGVSPILIPMHGAADSLNVAVAAGVLGYEVKRQRNNKTKKQS